MDAKQRQLLNKYIDLLFRRKVLFLVMLLLGLPIGLGVYLLTPKVYETKSLLSYQHQKIGQEKRSSAIASRIRDTVSTLTQIATSRTNLEKLILQLDLYGQKRAKLPMEDVVDLMRKNIRIEPSDKGDIIQITFTHEEPGKAVKVTNSLASKFIEENLKYREERATETFSYTSDELLRARQVMDAKENAMRDYKVKYYNEMPGQRVSNVSRLIALQEQYQGKQESIQDFERTLVLIQDQLTNRKKYLEELQIEDIGVETTDNVTAIGKQMSKRQQLVKLRSVLGQMLIRYTEKHPEVRRTKNIISRLERELALEGSSAEEGIGDGDGVQLSPVKAPTDQIVAELELRRKNVLLNIRNLEAEKIQLKKTIAKYEKWVSSAPIREAEWSAITREYGQLKRHYEYLVAQDLEAKSMLNLEKRQKGNQFRIEDPARVPEKPKKPNFLVIMGMAFLVSLGGTGGLVLFFDFLDSSFRDPEVIESTLGVPLIATIPFIPVKLDKTKKLRKTIFTVLVLLLATGLVVALFAVVWSKGLIVI